MVCEGLLFRADGWRAEGPRVRILRSAVRTSKHVERWPLWRVDHKRCV